MKLKAWVERIAPSLVGAIGGIIFFGLAASGSISTIDKLNDLFSASINVAGISIGFLATMKAILLGSRDTPTVQALRSAKRWSSILSQIRWALIWSFGVAVISVICFATKQYVESHAGTSVNQWLCAAWGFFAFGAIASAYLVIDLLFEIVSAD